ncbi:MAG TPA: hypothetical protein VLJ88_15870 [Propionibacteriaceae bacterium]|nr:hypothetical protein [Propionibacteriaceae bacterium]
MRVSDQILHDDLLEAGLQHLAARAAAGEWNDYFGDDAMPQHALIAVLRDEVVIANVVRKQLIQNVIDGKYDGTRADADEWAASPEGQAVLGELIQPRRGGDL